MIAPLVNPRVARVRRCVVRCRDSLPLRQRPAMSRKRESPYTTRITIALPPALSAALSAASDKYDVAVAVLARGAIERGVKLELDARRKQARHKPRHPARQLAPRPAPSARPLTLADIAHIEDADRHAALCDKIAVANAQAGLGPAPSSTSVLPPLTDADIDHIKDDDLFFTLVDKIAAANATADLRPTPAPPPRAEDED